jgi:hypothetical protein
MARARIHHYYGDGTHTLIEVSLDEDYPDAVAECTARARVRDLWRETCVETDEAE